MKTITEEHLKEIQLMCREWLSDPATNRDSRLTISAGANLPRDITIEIKSILTFDDVLITTAIDAETGFCYTKLIGKSGEAGTFIDAPFEMISAGELESAPGGVATGSVISGVDPVSTAPGTDPAASIRPYDHRSMAAETEDGREKYLLCSNGTVLGFSALEKTKSGNQRTGRFFPSDDYFEFAGIFAEFPQAENDCLEANVREAYGLKDEDRARISKKVQ